MRKKQLSILWLLIFLWSSFAWADLQEGTYTLETGSWQFYFGPAPNTLAGSNGRIDSNAGQWSFFNTYWGENPSIISQNGRSILYSN